MNDVAVEEEEVIEEEESYKLEEYDDKAVVQTVSLLGFTNGLGLFTKKEILDFLKDEMWIEHPEAGDVMTDFYHHPRGPKDNDYIPSELVMNLCLDLLNVMLWEEEE